MKQVDIKMTNEFAVFGVWHEYGKKIRVIVETCKTEEEAETAFNRIENANSTNIMYEYYEVDEA